MTDKEDTSHSQEFLRHEFLSHKILQPIQQTEFFSTYWEKLPCHISRSQETHFSELLSPTDIEELLVTQDLFFPAFQVIESGRTIAVGDFTSDDGRVLPHRAMQHYHDGATLILSEAHKTFATLGNLCRSVNKDFQMGCQANVYLSPAGCQGFDSHYDTHDVFILQVSGNKTFRFYPSDIELPFTNDTYNPELNPKGMVDEQIKLEAGDTLYIPRGVVHDAIAENEQASLHITLGLYPHIVKDVLQEILQTAAESDVDFRRSTLLPDTDTTSLLQQAQQMLKNALNEENVTTAISRLQDKTALAGVGAYNKLLMQPDITDTSYIRIKSSSVLNIERIENQIKLRLIGQIMHFTDPLAEAVETIIERGNMQVAQLSELEPDQRIALIKHLLYANVIELH